MMPTAVDALPRCPSPQPESVASPESVAPPRTVPSVADPSACRARPTRVEPTGAGRLPVPQPGYHHLGATTTGEWAGVLGRLGVRDPAVRAGAFDFVATRFLARRGVGNGRVAWLEVGWAETGWGAAGRQRIYTFDSVAMAWTFFDEYEIGDGDRIWVYLHSDTEAGRPVWRAWLWWGQRWRLLAAPALPLRDRARLEQYVEVHRDGPGPAVRVPPIRIDQVRVATDPGSDRLRPWRPETVPTGTLPTPADYCLSWEQEYHAWSAGDCPATVQG